MSMLAERRRKQKGTLNPRGKWWTEDSNKFGQRMLEKMGWTRGKGLGINEQGITEFSSTSHKNDKTGIGYNKNFEAWIEQQEKFGNFLQQLNGNQDGEKSVNGDASLSGQSIELKSKQSHARVHYKKFTCGKDINRYKSKDLANIFGQKELSEKTQIEIEKDNNIRKIEAGIKDNWYGVVTINGGNITDYFKHKSNYNNMTDYSKYNVKSNNDTSLSSNMTDNQMIDSESENQHIGFGFTSKTEDTSVSNYRFIKDALKDSDDKSNYAFDNPCLGSNSPTETAGTNKSSTKSIKKRKKKFESDNSHITEIDEHDATKKLRTETIDSDYKNGFVNPALNLDTKLEEDGKDGKDDKDGKEFEVFRAEFGLENCGLDLTDERNDKRRVTFNDHIMLYEYDINSSKKKKKGEATLDKFEVENKKNKKKRKHESTTTSVTNGFVNEALDVQILSEEINNNELNEHRNKKIKKRKICKTSNLETIQESPEKEIIEINIESEHTSNNTVENEKTDTVEQKSKKKKKKEKRAEVEDITVLHVINKESDIEIIEVINNKKIKKAKDNKKEEEMSKKCKKKKKKDKENCKNEKHTIQTEMNNDQQDIGILDKSDSTQQQNNIYLIENENKNAAIETVSVSTTKEEKPLEKTKKKKKRKSINKEDCSNEINVCNLEREISDKENTDKEQDLNIKKLAKKDKKSKKSRDNVFDIRDSSNSNKEVVDVNVTKQNEIENIEFTDTPSKKGKVIDTVIDNIVNSPWSVKARMSKKMLITLFHNNAILEFPGSNIHNIKGYGADVECEL